MNTVPKIRFSCSGSEWAVDAEVGTTVMLAAVSEGGVDGITAECGGNAMCATCHVYVDPETATSLPSMTQEEDDMLDCAAGGSVAQLADCPAKLQLPRSSTDSGLRWQVTN